MNETTMQMVLHDLLDRGWAPDHPVSPETHSARFWLDSPDGDTRAIFDFSDEQIEVVRFSGGRARLIAGEATFRGAMLDAVVPALVEAWID